MPDKKDNNGYQANRRTRNGNSFLKDTGNKMKNMANKFENSAANRSSRGKNGAVGGKFTDKKSGVDLATIGAAKNKFVRNNPNLGKNKLLKSNDNNQYLRNGVRNSNDFLSKSIPGISNLLGGKSSTIFNRAVNKKNGVDLATIEAAKEKFMNDNSGDKKSDELSSNDDSSSNESSSTNAVSGSGFISFINKYKKIIVPMLPVLFIILIIFTSLLSVIMSSDEEGSGKIREEDTGVVCASDSKLVDVALKEVGNNEADGTHAKYLKFLGFSPNTAWCAAFVSWCANQAGIDTSAIPHTASVSSFLAYFQKAGTFKSINSSYKPTSGNLIIWKAKGHSHIGIVKEYDGSKDTLVTVEGNSSDAVRVNTYKFSSLESRGVVGFASPQQMSCTDTTDGNNATTIKNGHSINIPKNLGTHATREFDLASNSVEINYAREMIRKYRKIVNPYAFPPNTSQRKVQDKWISAGAKHDSKGFCKLDGRYLVATTSTFGNIGDKVDFYMSSGKIIHVILGDAKSQNKAWYDQNPADKWGHSNGRNILEFMGKNSIGDNPYYTLGLNGQSVVKAVNGGSIFK